MNFNEMETKKNLMIFSHRIAEILITEFGVKELMEIRYLKPTEKNSTTRKVYIFRNSPDLFKIFREYTYKEDYQNTTGIPHVREVNENG